MKHYKPVLGCSTSALWLLIGRHEKVKNKEIDELYTRIFVVTIVIIFYYEDLRCFLRSYLSPPQIPLLIKPS